MFDQGGDKQESGPQPPQRPEMPPRKLFKVQRWSAKGDELDTFIIEAHFMAPLDGGRMAFNVYDFDSPQGVSTVRVIESYYDIEQITPSGIVH